MKVKEDIRLGMKCILGVLALFASNLILVNEGQAQDAQDCIYGTVYTKSGKEYVGFLQWGKEEIYWHDIFNSNKIQQKEFFDFDEAKKQKWFDIDWDLESIWEDKYKTSYRSFACYFGDIKRLELKGNEKVNLVFKNDHVVKLNSGSNDVGGRIIMEDYELGRIKLDWSKIETIEFQSALVNQKSPYGKPIYGVVKTRRKGEFEGYIKWDLDERHGDEILDGDSDDGSKEIPFRNIAKIEKDGSGCNVTLNSGREIYLDDSNDVDHGNRGIEIYQEGIGSVEVKWKEFVSLEMIEPESDAVSYSSFGHPAALCGEVETFDEGIYSGLMVYDMDEMWGPEMLDGEDDYLTFQIPFRNIKEIIPKNSNYSKIVFLNGQELLLGDTQDVSGNNDGVLILSKDGKDPFELEWEDIIFIRFK